MVDLISELRIRADELGFNAIGICGSEPARRVDAYLHWIQRGYQGEMGYMARPDRVRRRQDPRIILPGLRSIILVGFNYASVTVPPEIAGDPSRGRISNYAWGVDYHEIMVPLLEELAAWLRKLDPKAVSRVYVDTGAILERDHAETAGIGFTGKNTMLIAPRSGSWFFIGEILTTLELPTTSRSEKLPSCGTCRRCMDACPTGAFPAPYVLDARRCISYLSIELKGWIPHEFRPLMGNWIYGCDICQDVCPFNRFASPTAEIALQPIDLNKMAPPLLQVLKFDDSEFKRRFWNSPIKRIKRGRLVRNACVAAGNWGHRSAVPVLAKLLKDREAIVRGHAAWALHQIDDGQAQLALRDALIDEKDEEVRKELLG